MPRGRKRKLDVFIPPEWIPFSDDDDGQGEQEPLERPLLDHDEQNARKKIL